jgi:hypothetical protein
VDQAKPFCYQPSCSAHACDRPASFKIAAAWSDGTSRELKNYGLACDLHRESQLTAARERHRALKRSDGESVGPVELFVLRTGCRDVELTRLVDGGENFDASTALLTSGRERLV